ncbi:hypothetical protein J6590_044089 [Homalodisca vitripennis]|nr:hypothetical protein J6590_044089 [Homalodisca vitripennis]
MALNSLFASTTESCASHVTNTELPHRQYLLKAPRPAVYCSRTCGCFCVSPNALTTFTSITIQCAVPRDALSRQAGPGPDNPRVFLYADILPTAYFPLEDGCLVLMPAKVMSSLPHLLVFGRPLLQNRLGSLSAASPVHIPTSPVPTLGADKLQYLGSLDIGDRRINRSREKLPTGIKSLHVLHESTTSISSSITYFS